MYQKLNLLDLFKHETPVKYTVTQTVFNEGDIGDHFYVVRSGTILLRTGNRTLERLHSGAIFGELALIDNEKRAATAEVEEDAELYVIDEKRFHFLIQQNPYFSQYVMKVMADRLRRVHRHE